MEHPLIGNIDDLTEDQLLEKVNELYGKLSIAQRTGNSHLANQVRMAIESFQNKYQQRLAEQQKREAASVNFDNKINIK